MRYDQLVIDALGKVGKAFRTPDGSYAHPVVDLDDLKAAREAADPDDEALQRYLDRRERELDERDKGGDETVTDSDVTDGQKPQKSPARKKKGKRPKPSKVESDAQQDGSSSSGNPNAAGVADGSGSLASRLPVTVRAAGSSAGGLVLEGAPIIYNVAYQVYERSLGSFLEVMAPGACTRVLGENQSTVFLFDHRGLPLARVPTTLSLWDTPAALQCRAVLDPDNQTAADLYRAVARGDVHQMSVGMIVGDDEFSRDGAKRVVKRIDQLLDCSAVTNPASPRTWIKVAATGADRQRGRAWAQSEIRRVRHRAA